LRSGGSEQEVEKDKGEVRIGEEGEREGEGQEDDREGGRKKRGGREVEREG
jgi:hypothetical protein